MLRRAARPRHSLASPRHRLPAALGLLLNTVMVIQSLGMEIAGTVK